MNNRFDGSLKKGIPYVKLLKFIRKKNIMTCF